VDVLLGWLNALPPAALYAVLAVLAFGENIFPPAPSDTIIAFGTFLAARGQAALAYCLVAILGGHLVGAAVVWMIGRRWGADKVHTWLAERGERAAEETFQRMYGSYGFAALLVGRFVPFVRGVVPLAAGAFRISLAQLSVAVLVHAGVWYGLIAIVAYQVGENFDQLLAAMKRGGATLGVVAAVVALAGGAWWWRRRRQRRRA
jgi:membrane protein DedA with SNARE-associated domain